FPECRQPVDSRSGCCGARPSRDCEALRAMPSDSLAHVDRGKWGYLITETTATIGTYSIDKDTGNLTEVAYVDTGDYNQKDSAFASDIHVTPNGKFLYGAVRTTSMLHGNKIDPEKGTLTATDKWPTEKTPRGLNTDPRA